MKMVCRKCGGKCRVVVGQQLNKETGNFKAAYKVACVICDNSGPVCRTERGAIDAWDEQNSGAELLNGTGGAVNGCTAT